LSSEGFARHFRSLAERPTWFSRFEI